MELIEGETLGQWLKRGALPPLEALRICGDVARALGHGWQRAQLIHRDIKPGNIFLSIHGEVKVGDLGLAKTMGGDTTGLTQTGTAMGTPHYISPEQARGEKDLDFRADIYSLGCTLFQMLTGQTPYSGGDPMSVMLQHINSPPPAILKVWPQCPIPVARLVGKMLKKAKRERHASYEDLLNNIESVRALYDPSTATAPPTPPDPDATILEGAPTPRVASATAVAPVAKSKLPLYGGIAAGVVILGAVAALLWPRDEKLTKAQLYAQQREAEQQQIREVAPAPGSAVLATKDAPFVNTLGMKFVPKSPGSQVFFSIWETRRIDYAAFARAKKVDDSWTKQEKDGVPVSGGAFQPVVGVNWSDAKAFCGWLNEKEIAEGKLPAGLKYRLPTDEEWSSAVGLPEEPGATPAERDRQDLTRYPWGTDWPPKVVVGNYADEAFHAKFPAKGDYNQWVKGYSDGATNTASVGSFPPNEAGIYDLGGNVWEWCENLFDATQNHRISRGGSWAHGDKSTLLSSYRRHENPDTRTNNVGFRVVLAADGSTPPAARLSLTAEPWQDVLRDPARLTLSKTVERTPDGLSFAGGSAYLKGSGPDGALRIRTTVGGLRPAVRARETSAGFYALSVRDEKALTLARYDPAQGRSTMLREFPLPVPLRAGQDYEMELRAVGSTLTVTLNGEVLGAVTDSVLGEGAFCVGITERGGSPKLVKSIELLDLKRSVAPAAEAWQDLLRDPAKLNLSGKVERVADGLLFSAAGGVWSYGEPEGQRDGAVRLRTTFGGVRPILRARQSTRGGSYQLATSGNGILLSRYDDAAGRMVNLQEFPLRTPLEPGQDYTLELRVVGQTLTAKFNDEVLGTLTDGTLTEGRFNVAVGEREGAPTLIKSLEVLDLDTAAANPKATALAEAWQDVLRDPAKMGALAGAERTPEGVRFTGPGGALLRPDPNIRRDGAVRMRATYGGVRVGLRGRRTVTSGMTGGYHLWVVSDKAVSLALLHPDSSQNVVLRQFDLPVALQPGAEYELELRVVGAQLTVKFNGEVLGTVTDATFPTGDFSLACWDADRGPTLIKSLEVLNLDSPVGGSGPPAVAPATATKDAPFVNGLGMKFVPVPITGGPTGGQRVLFSVWDTRVQDFEVFAKETKLDWKKASDVEQGPEHPVVNVSWEDATAFCAWLTERERKAGKLGANEVYRLPSDHEWSCAVGIGEREDAGKLPSEKSQKIADEFPWGSAWPPPEKAGNYWSEELRPALEAGKHSWIKGELPGYHDGFATTSPVGSFPANRFGLYDMGGNLWQWCGDWFDQEQKDRVLRGAAWDIQGRGNLLSANRYRNAPGSRYINHGFRCVVGVSAR